jgi:hypothetical protein
MLRRVVLVRTDVSEEPGVSFIRVTRIGELGTTQAATSNRRTLRRFLQEPHGVTSQKTSFFSTWDDNITDEIDWGICYEPKMLTKCCSKNLKRRNNIVNVWACERQAFITVMFRYEFTFRNCTSLVTFVVSSSYWKRVICCTSIDGSLQRWLILEEWRLLGCYAVWLL